jgi:hypothetical protein
MASIISAGTTDATSLNVSGDKTGILQLASNNGTTAITVDTSQNVGIGTTTPKVRLAGKVLSINGTDSGASYQASIELLVNGASAGEMWANSNDFVIGSFSTQPMIFRTQNTERMRITSSGNFGIGTTTGLNSKVTLYSDCNALTAMEMRDTGTTGGYLIAFYNSSSNLAGGIIHNGTTTVNYSTSSDYRMKENIAPMTGALSKVALLNPVTYKWKEEFGGESGQGFIAHELQAVVPEAVAGAKDALNEDGSIKPQGIDTSFLVATLTAALQETKALIDTQAETINALTARIGALETA